ncbi:MAG: hypothetical protein WD039_02330, partial [Xanthobacteraceae bacterium]
IGSRITLADIGFVGGIRFDHLGGRREIFIPLPQDAGIKPTELVLAIDDISAHEARRSFEILVNDRVVSALALDGRGMDRLIRLPLTSFKARGGFLKLSFLYSGAATQDRCMDARYVGDSLTIRPETAIEFEVPATARLDVPATVALMPRDVAVVLPERRLDPSDIAAALTVARSLAASGRHISFHRGGTVLADLAKSAVQHRWSQGIVVIGGADEFSKQIDEPIIAVAGPTPGLGTIAAVRVAGFPALLVAGADAVRAGRLLASPSLSVTRGLTEATVGTVGGSRLPAERVSFDELGVTLEQVDVIGRAELSVTIDTRDLPPSRFMSRIALDILVAPDSAGEKAVVSVFVNERLLGSTLAAAGQPTRLDLALPQGLVTTTVNIRTVVQRRSAQGDCRFAPQGYPAQILGSSTVVLSKAGAARDFADLLPLWANGVELLLPQAAAERPQFFLALLSNILNALSPDSAPITVKFIAAESVPAPKASFIAVSGVAPEGATPLVHFDRGRVAVTDRKERVLLDLGDFGSGAVAQLVTAGAYSGMWIKPLSADGALPNPGELRLARGDIAVFDNVGMSLAMSTERDTLVKISYPERTSWDTVATRFQPWIVGALWLFATVLFLFALTRMYRRNANAARD